MTLGYVLFSAYFSLSFTISGLNTRRERGEGKIVPVNIKMTRRPKKIPRAAKSSRSTFHNAFWKLWSRKKTRTKTVTRTRARTRAMTRARAGAMAGTGTRTMTRARMWTAMRMAMVGAK